MSWRGQRPRTWALSFGHLRCGEPVRVHWFRGSDTTNPRRVFISGQKRGVFGAIKRELRRRSAIEAVIGHMKNDGHLGRCYLKGRDCDAANIILTATGYTFDSSSYG